MGSTKESTKRLTRERIEFHLEGLREDSLPIRNLLLRLKW